MHKAAIAVITWGVIHKQVHELGAFGHDQGPILRMLLSEMLMHGLHSTNKLIAQATSLSKVGANVLVRLQAMPLLTSNYLKEPGAPVMISDVCQICITQENCPSYSFIASVLHGQKG